MHIPKKPTLKSRDRILVGPQKHNFYPLPINYPKGSHYLHL